MFKRKVPIPSVHMDFLIQVDTPLETLDPSINCSPSVIATITVIQGLLVKLQVQQLMSAPLACQTVPSGRKQEWGCACDCELCLLFLKGTCVRRGRPRGACESSAWMCGGLRSGSAAHSDLCSWGGQDTCLTGIWVLTQQRHYITCLPASLLNTSTVHM